MTSVDGESSSGKVRVADLIRDIKLKAVVTEIDAAMFVAWCIESDAIQIESLSSEGVEERYLFDTDTFLEITSRIGSRNTEKPLFIAAESAEGIAKKAASFDSEELLSLVREERTRREAKWEKSRCETLDNLDRLVREEPKQIFKLICESVVNGGSPLFIRLERVGSDGVPHPHIYRKLAEICLKKLDDTDRAAEVNSGLMPLDEFVFSEFSARDSMNRPGFRGGSNL